MKRLRVWLFDRVFVCPVDAVVHTCSDATRIIMGVLYLGALLSSPVRYYGSAVGLVVDDNPDTRTLAEQCGVAHFIHWGANTDPVELATIAGVAITASTFLPSPTCDAVPGQAAGVMLNAAIGATLSSNVLFGGGDGVIEGGGASASAAGGSAGVRALQTTVLYLRIFTFLCVWLWL